MENMDVKPEAEMASKKPSKMKAIFAAVIAVVLVLGGVYYFVFGQEQAEPPSLGPGTGTFQGLIQTGKYNFMTFDQSEIDAWTEPSGDFVELKVDGNNLGLFTIFSSVEKTGKDLLEAIDHNMTEEFMIAVYDDATAFTSEDLSEYHDLAWITSEQDFYSAVGSLLAKVDQTELENYKFEPFKAVVVYTNKDTKLYGDWHLAGDSIEGNYDFCSGNIGWTNAVSAVNLKEQFKDCVPDEVFQFVEAGQNEGIKYEEVLDYMDVTNLQGNDMIWVYYEDMPGTKKVTEEAPKEEEPPVVEGCDKYSDPEDLVAAAQTAVADLDFAAAYCLVDEKTKDAVDNLIDAVRNSADKLKAADSADGLKEMIPEFMEISKDAEAMGQLLQFFKVGDADVLYDEYVQNEKEMVEKVLSKSDDMLSELSKLASTEGDNLAFLEQFSVIVGKVRAEAEELPQFSQTSKDITEYLEMFRNAKATVTELSSSAAVMQADVMSALKEKGIANTVVEFKPVAPYNTINGTPQDSFKVTADFIKDEDGYLSVMPVDLHTHVFEVVDEKGDVFKYEGIKELFNSYVEKLKEFVDKEGEKIALLPGFLDKMMPIVKEYANNAKIDSIIEGLKVFVEFSQEVGGNVTFDELTGTADANGLQFTSNQYSQWLGLFYGEPYVAQDGRIMYFAYDGSEGTTDYAAYIVGEKDVDFMDLFGDTALTVRFWTIDVQEVQQFTDEEFASLDFFTRDDDSKPAMTGIDEATRAEMTKAGIEGMEGATTSEMTEMEMTEAELKDLEEAKTLNETMEYSNNATTGEKSENIYYDADFNQ